MLQAPATDSPTQSLNGRLERLVNLLQAAHAKFDGIERNILPQRPQECAESKPQPEAILSHLLGTAEDLAQGLDQRIGEVLQNIG